MSGVDRHQPVPVPSKDISRDFTFIKSDSSPSSFLNLRSHFPLFPCVICCRTMTSVDFLAQEKIWFDKARYDQAERCFYERMNGSSQVPAQGQVAVASLPFRLSEEADEMF